MDQPTETGFFSLPRELRDQIYNLACTDHVHSTNAVPLHLADPPSKNFILTFKTEAYALYPGAYRAYWLNTPFTVDRWCPVGGSKHEILASIRQNESLDIFNIRDLSLVTHRGPLKLDRDPTNLMIVPFWQVEFLSEASIWRELTNVFHVVREQYWNDGNPALLAERQLSLELKSLWEYGTYAQSRFHHGKEK